MYTEILRIIEGGLSKDSQKVYNYAKILADKMSRDGETKMSKMILDSLERRWKSHATLTLLATQDLPTFGYNMIDPLKSWCWGSILFYPFKTSRFS